MLLLGVVCLGLLCPWIWCVSVYGFNYIGLVCFAEEVSGFHNSVLVILCHVFDKYVL